MNESTRYDLALALMNYITIEALERIAVIGRARTDCHVEMDFKHGRCLAIKVTDVQRFSGKDFTEQDDVDNLCGSG